jgi:hypothetical protein
MFRLYGDTLEPDELADFNIPQKIADIDLYFDNVIANEPVFTKYGINNFAEFKNREQNDSSLFGYEVTDAAIVKDTTIMNDAIYGGAQYETIKEWYNSPIIRRGCLLALEHRYTNQQTRLDVYVEHDLRPLVARVAERLLATGNNSLINEYLMTEFSLYAAVTGVFVIVTVLLLVIPMLIVDRSRGINLLQYSSTTGRKILRIQFGATLVSAFILSVVLTAVSFTPFIALAGEYWNASIMSLGNSGMWLYDITFGQSAFIFAGMITALSIGASCVAFILARFSTNIVNVMIKAVPVGAALSAVCAFALYYSLSYNNMIFNQVFRGRFDMA